MSLKESVDAMAEAEAGGVRGRGGVALHDMWCLDQERMFARAPNLLQITATRIPYCILCAPSF